MADDDLPPLKPLEGRKMQRFIIVFEVATKRDALIDALRRWRARPLLSNAWVCEAPWPSEEIVGKMREIAGPQLKVAVVPIDPKVASATAGTQRQGNTALSQYESLPPTRR